MLTPLMLSMAVAAAAPVMPHIQGTVSAEELSSSVSDIVADTAQAKSGDRVVTVKGEELSFIDQYYPFVLDDNLHPNLDDNKVIVWVLSFFLYWAAGPLWIPTLADVELDEEYTEEALIGWLLHCAGYLLYFVFIWPGWVYYLANGLYFGPVHILNTANRHVTGAKRRGKGKSKRKSALADLPGMPSVAAAAY